MLCCKQVALVYVFAMLSASEQVTVSTGFKKYLLANYHNAFKYILIEAFSAINRHFRPKLLKIASFSLSSRLKPAPSPPLNSQIPWKNIFLADTPCQKRKVPSGIIWGTAAEGKSPVKLVAAGRLLLAA